jgi:hypothetical protein
MCSGGAATGGRRLPRLWESEDRSSFRTLLSLRGRDPEAAFEEAYGFPFAEAEDRYLAEAPGSYPRRWACVTAPLGAVSSDTWRQTVMVDCDASESQGSGARQWVLRTAEIQRAAYYNVTIDPGGLLALLCCQTEPGPTVVPEAESELRDERHARHEEWTYPDGGGSDVEGGTPAVLFVDAGAYEVTVERYDRETGALTVAIWPALVVGPAGP